MPGGYTKTHLLVWPQGSEIKRSVFWRAPSRARTRLNKLRANLMFQRFDSETKGYVALVFPKGYPRKYRSGSKLLHIASMFSIMKSLSAWIDWHQRLQIQRKSARGYWQGAPNGPETRPVGV
jgi:hypothetical protein